MIYIIFFSILILSIIAVNNNFFGIHERYFDNREYYKKDHVDISYKVALTIRKDFQKQLKTDKRDNVDLRNIWVKEYFGKYNDCTALYMGSDLTYNAQMRTEEIAGYIFIFPSSEPLYIHKDSKFYDIREAYDKGFITKENVYQIGSKSDLTFSRRNNDFDS